jgi:alpha-D-xyloside xylohydrolase
MKICLRLVAIIFIFTFLFIQLSFCENNYRQIQNGVQLHTSGKIVQVQFYTSTIVRIQKWDDTAKPDSASLIVIQKPKDSLIIDIQDEGSILILHSTDLLLSLTKSDGSVVFKTPRNLVLLKELGPANIQLLELKKDTAFTIEQKFQLTQNEGIYGLGQHQYGYMNYRGRTVKLVQTNTDAVTPFLISTMNYGILWDNYSKTIFHDDTSGASLWSEVANGIDYYFISGANMDSVISGYRYLSGQAPLYGKWAYGYWQSKEHYENRAELLHVTQEYRKRQIPIDNIIQDWDYWDGAANWGQLFFDDKKYPQPKEMIDQIHKNNFHIMISVWPGLGPNTAVYKEMQKRGYLYSPVGWAGFRYYDAYNPKANDLYWQYADTGLFAKGIDAWWFDSTEPDVINALTKESTEYELKRMENNYLGSFARYLNPYSLLITEATYKHQRQETDQKRVYILTRSTFAGQQRAAATTWSGDIGADWPIYKIRLLPD